MASAITHALVGFAFGPLLVRGRWAWGAAAACAVLPDADVIGFALGVRYESMLGHRGLSHSLAFALTLATIVALLARRERGRMWWLIALATASHGVLDAFTDGGLGVAFLAPFSDARWFAPWRPIAVSPISVTRFFSARGLAILASEALWVWLPAAMMLLLGAWRLRRRTPIPND